MPLPEPPKSPWQGGDFRQHEQTSRTIPCPALSPRTCFLIRPTAFPGISLHPHSCYWDTSNPWDTSSLWDQSFKNYSNYKRLQNTSFFSLHKVEHSHRELWEVRVLLCTTGITFERTASNPSIRGAHEMPHQRAPSATPGLTARLGGHWQIRSCSIKILRSTASYFSKRAGSDLMIFIDRVKLKLLCWHCELMQNLFCWAGTESSSGLSLWLFFSL